MCLTHDWEGQIIWSIPYFPDRIPSRKDAGPWHGTYSRIVWVAVWAHWGSNNVENASFVIVYSYELSNTKLKKIAWAKAQPLKGHWSWKWPTRHYGNPNECWPCYVALCAMSKELSSNLYLSRRFPINVRTSRWLHRVCTYYSNFQGQVFYWCNRQICYPLLNLHSAEGIPNWSDASSDGEKCITSTVDKKHIVS